jgi:hypothetical protein
MAEGLAADERMRTEGVLCVIGYERACGGWSGFAGRVAD